MVPLSASSPAVLADAAWAELGWLVPRGFHPRLLDKLRLKAEQDGGMQAVLDCRVNATGIACGHCHNCGAKLAFPEARSCERCGSSDADE